MVIFQYNANSPCLAANDVAEIMKLDITYAQFANRLNRAHMILQNAKIVANHMPPIIENVSIFEQF